MPFWISTYDENITGGDREQRRGPRSDPGEARSSILAAARAEFGRLGYEGTTMRGVAGSAGVDVALLAYYFGSKNDLFMASLELPVNPAEVLTAILEQGIEGAAERVLSVLLRVWDDPATGAPLIAMLRSVSTHDTVLREFIESRMVAAIAATIDGRDAELRASAFTSQVVGLALERYVLKVEPLASAGRDALVDLVAPNLQRYLEPGR